MNDQPAWLRPSMLPKLALCGHYRSEANAGAAAARGTKLDTHFRESVEEAESEEKPEDEEFPDEASVDQGERQLAAMVRSNLAGANVDIGALDPDDRQAVTWARNTARALAGGAPLESREEHLRVEALGLSGTADLLCESQRWSADLKSGQRRNYVEQQAAYAIGFMDKFFVEDWTVYLFYCDQEETETLRFTYESATEIAKRAIANARDVLPPKLNDYCGWCARRFTCPTRREALGDMAMDGPIEAAKSDTLRDFVLRGSIVKDFVKRARGILFERVGKGEKIAGVSVTNRKGSEKVPANIVGRWLKQLGHENVLAAYGDMTKAKFMAIWDKMMPGKDFPKEHIVTGSGTSFPRITRPKA